MGCTCSTPRPAVHHWGGSEGDGDILKELSLASRKSSKSSRSSSDPESLKKKIGRRSGVEIPLLPGDIALCGELSQEAAVKLAPNFASWINVNSANDPCFFRKDLQKAGVEFVEVRPFPGPPLMPSEAEVTSALRAVETLPKPMMIQCNTGSRSGALLLLWLVERHGYTPNAAEQLGVDSDLDFWQRCSTCGRMREWLLSRCPAINTGAIRRPAVGLTFVQLYDPESSSFTYLLGCEETKEAVLIDPVLDQRHRDLELLVQLGMKLHSALNTHVHEDHVTSAGLLRAQSAKVRTLISKASGARADVLVGPGDRWAFGKFCLEAIPTPGHTAGCMSWFLPLPDDQSSSLLFSGDTLLVRASGRTDLATSDPGALYDSLHDKLLVLPGETAVYPSHEYKGCNATTIEEEKRFNKSLQMSKSDFIDFKKSKQDWPTKIEGLAEYVSANMQDGVADDWDVGGMTM